MSVASRPMTLADAALPRAGAFENTVLVVAASLLTAGAAQLEIHLPWTLVTITGQTWAVLLTAAALGPRRAFLAQMLYLLEGCAGLPVFAGGAFGVAHLIGPTGGYLIGFPFAALLTGALAERGWDRKPLTMFLAMLLGTGVVFALGLLQLARFVPPAALLPSGLLPFLLPDVIKSALAALAFPVTWKFVRRSEGRR